VEKEVRLAMAMSPKLESACQDVLRRLSERTGTSGSSAETPPAVAVKHTPRASGEQYAVATTTNFVIYHNQKPEFAERVARAAEGTRTAVSRKWFGDDGDRWEPRCEIYLHATAYDYSQATRTPASSPGHSTIERERDSAKIRSRRIDLHCDDVNMLPRVLPHETTHVSLAGRLGAREMPRWADEGMAVLSEPRERIDTYLNTLPQHNRDRLLFRAADLIRLGDKYPEGRYIGAFYAQSVSLVEYLASRKGPQVFARFLREGLDSGFEAALKKHYNIADFSELDRQWRSYALGEGTGTPVIASKH